MSDPLEHAAVSVGIAQAVLTGLGAAQSREETLQMGQLHATLAVAHLLVKCERHLESLTIGRSA